MPQCVKCKEFLPPDMVKDTIGGKLCHFCDKNQGTLIGDDDVMYVKAEVVHDYKELLEKLKDSKQIKSSVNDMIVETAVKRMNNG